MFASIVSPPPVLGVYGWLVHQVLMVTVHVLYGCIDTNFYSMSTLRLAIQGDTLAREPKFKTSHSKVSPH